MSQFFKNYFLDFWVWWYWFMARRVLSEVWADWLQTIGYLNLIPMATNMFRPLFQDRSLEGRFVAVPIRLSWVIVGTLILAFYTGLLLTALVCYFLIPVLPVFIIINNWAHFI